MKFVDYKCLESLLIEGEEIATEGIGSAISGIVKRVFGMISRVINIIIGIFRKMINNLRGKKPKNIISNNVTNTKSPLSTEINQDNESSKSKETEKSDNNDSQYKRILYSDIAYCLHCINCIISKANIGIYKIANNNANYSSTGINRDISDSELVDLEDKIDENYTIFEDIISKYDNSQCSICSKDKNEIIKSIDKTIDDLEDIKADLDHTTRTIKIYDVLQKNTNANNYINHVLKIIPKLENYTTKLSGIINNCEIIE